VNRLDERGFSFTSETLGTDVTSYGYDFDDRLKQITFPNSSTNTFTYNGFGARVGKTDSGGTVSFLLAGASPGAPVLKAGPTNYTPGISERTGGVTTYYHWDAGGHLSWTSGSNQTLGNFSQWDWFGLQVTGLTGAVGFAGSIGARADRDHDLFNLGGGGYYDPGTGLAAIRPTFITELINDTKGGADILLGGIGGLSASLDLPQGLIDFVSGWGDALSGGLTHPIRRWIGDLLGIGDPNGQINFDSGAHLGGTIVGIAHATALGGALGWLSGGIKAAGLEFSHWIPARFLNVMPDWIRKGIGRSKFNGNYVTPHRHALHDPFRYVKGMKKADKYHVVIQQLDRVPRVYYGAGAGCGYTSTKALLD
jgi:YD repeat-containing protein